MKNYRNFEFFIVFDVNAINKVVGNDMQTGGFRAYYAGCMITYTAKKFAAFHHDIHRIGHEEFYASNKCVDV